MIPTVESTIRLSRLFRRKPTTAWSDKEYKVYKRLFKTGSFNTLDDLELIERYYAFERSKRDDRGLHRRDLHTLLFNWQGELDRAREWERKHPIPRKIIPLPPAIISEPLILSTEDQERSDRFMAEFRARKGRLL